MSKPIEILISDQSPVAIIAASATWNIVYANKKALDLGLKVDDNLISALKNTYLSKNTFQHLLSQDKPFIIETSEEPTISYTVHSSYLTKEETWSITISENINSQNSQYADYNKLVKLAVDKLPIDVVIYDAELNFLYLNEVAVKDKKLRKWLIGKSILDYVAYRSMPKEHGVSRMSFFNSILDNKKEVSWIDEYHYKDGTDKYMMRHYYPFLQGGKVVFLFGCGVDMTKQKEVEQSLEKSIKELTLQNKLLNQFSYVTSHNLRSHSSNLLGLTGIIDIIQDNPHELSQVLHKIKQVSQNLDDTLYDLNAILNVKGDVLEDLNLKTLFKDIQSVLQNSIEKSEITITQDFKITELHLSKGNLNSVLQNLVSNAIKYASIDQKRTLHISSYTEDNDLIIKLQDNGIGIDLKKYGKKIFQLYQRFSPNHAEGKGIGLFLVKSQIHSMSGKISIDSELGKGTTFTITLPSETIRRNKNQTLSKRI